MFQRFMRVCSMILVIVLLVNMLPASALGAALREAQEADASEQLTSQEAITQEEEAPGEVTILGELTDKRTEYTKQYLLSDGTFMAAVYADAVHYEKNGAWEEIDNTLKAAAGAYTTTAGDWSVSFPQQLSSAKNITITRNGYTLSFGMAGRLNQNSGAVVASAGELVRINGAGGTAETFAVASAQTSPAQLQQVDLREAKAAAKFEQLVQDKLYSKLSYEGVYANTDIVYDLQSNRVKESVILSEYDSTLRGYRYTLNTGGMIPVLDDKGNIAFYAPDMETVVMTMPAPFLEDANGVYNADIQVTLTGSGSTYTLTYLLPRQWLADSQRAYPVVLDPVVNAGTGVNNIADQTVFSMGSMSHTWNRLEVGYDEDYGIARFFVAFTSLPTLTSSDVIVDATVSLYKCYANSVPLYAGVHSVSSTWTSSGITWSNKPSTGTNAEDFNMMTSAGWYKWDVTNLARSWYETGNNTGMMFRTSDGAESEDTGDWAQFYSSDYGSYSPTLTIEYRNTSGLEDYWDYFSASAGRAGTGYVNAASGNLVWVRDLLGFDGNRMPVSISTIYNASERNANTFCMGYGWRTNFHQRILTSSDYYVWEDADGTKHFFAENDDGDYVDEDGLDLTLTFGSGDTRYCITDIYGNKSYFDASGQLKKIQNNQATPSSITIAYYTTGMISTITDGVGRKYTFVYDEDTMVERISYYGTGSDETDDETDDEIAYVSLSYTDGLLTSITDQDGKSSQYTYSNRLLTSAQEPGGYKVVIASSGTTNSTIRRVTSLTQYQGNTIGTSVSLAYAEKSTTVTDGNNNKQHLFFNDYCNTISVQDSEGRAQYTQYAKDSDYSSGRIHQVVQSSEMLYTAANLLQNNNFEEAPATTLSQWTKHSGTGTLSVVSDGYDSPRAIKVSGEATKVISQYEVTMTPGESYSFSAYVKVDTDTESNGQIIDAAHIGIYSMTGEILAVSESVYEGYGWCWIQACYTNDTQSNYTIKALLDTDTATVCYIDCVQLEATTTANPYNLLNNGDFTQGTTGWTKADGSLTANRTILVDSAAPQLDFYCLLVNATATSATTYWQTVYVTGEAEDSFVFGGWAKGEVATLDKGGRVLGLSLTFQYTDGTQETFQVSFMSGTSDWQYAAVQAVAQKAYSSIKVSLNYNANIASVCFDGFQLTRRSIMTTYTYFDNGDLKEVTDPQGNTTTYGYTSRDITQVSNPNGTVIQYTYDMYHNLLTAHQDATTVVYTYDAYGNLTECATSVVADSVSKTTTESWSYTADRNRLLTATDAYGVTTTYTYNKDTNVLEKVEYSKPKKQLESSSVYSTVYSYDSMYRTTKVTHTTDQGKTMIVNYGYTNDQLTSVSTAETADSVKTAYTFTYGNFGLTQSVKIGSRTLASYSYNNKNQITDLDYGNGDSVEYTYDDKGRVVQMTYEDSGYVKYYYNSWGALAQIIDSSGNSCTYYYDSLGQLVQYSINDGDVVLSAVNQYDDLGRVTSRKEMAVIAGILKSGSYTYTYGSEEGANKDLLLSLSCGAAGLTYQYDSSKRLTRYVTSYNGISIKTDAFTYTDTDQNNRNQISTHSATYGGTTRTYGYEYDNWGNIRTISKDGSVIASYEYDTAGQLIRENNEQTKKTYVWAYDGAGNILSRTEYSNSTSVATANLTGGTTITYTYGNSSWGDLLTKYNNEYIYYDTIGNIASDDTWTYIWEHGRQLKSMQSDDVAWTYTYDANGLRTGRSTGTTQNDHTYTYYYNGSQLSYMLYDNILLQFTYSASGVPLSVTTSLAGRAEEDACYYYVTNIQGDVIAILNHAGYEVVTYSYDAWGNILSVGGTLASTLGAYNPLRYRGYVYDQETGLYYLQSRYYSPKLSRFINADDVSYLGADGSFTSYNLFTYCANNPVMYIDPTGHVLDTFVDICFLILDIAYLVVDPSQENWLALAVDFVFTAIPFATGGARQILKIGDDVADIKNFSKVTIVGETMDRVKDTAILMDNLDNLYGGYTSYNKLSSLGKGGKILAEIGGKASNLKWLYGKLRSGFTVVDIGIDIGRATRSSSYITERIFLGIWQSRNLLKALYHFGR